MLERDESLKVFLEIFLPEELQIQSQRLAKLFAAELKYKTPEEYIATLPKFKLQLDNWKGGLCIPIIAETRVPLKRMLELAGIDFYFDVDSITDWKEGKFTTPKTPYTTWVNDGTFNLGKSVKLVRESLKAHERGANIYEVIALYLRDPEILDKHWLDIPGSQVDSDSVPFLGRWGRKGRPELSRHLADFARPHYGSVVATVFQEFK